MRVAVIETTVAGSASTETLAPARKFPPVMVTSVVPLAGPRLGDTEDTIGAGARYVKAAGSSTPLPSLFSTVNETTPSDCAGVRTTSRVVANDATVPVIAPKRTITPALKLVPLIVTRVPPLISPLAGVNVDTVGAGAVGAGAT